MILGFKKYRVRISNGVYRTVEEKETLIEHPPLLSFRQEMHLQDVP